MPCCVYIFIKAHRAQLRVLKLTSALIAVSQVSWCMSCMLVVQIVKSPDNFHLECVLQAAFVTLSYMSFCFSESYFALSYW